MICEICGCEYVYSCPHCMRSIGAWGQDGLLFLRELAKSEKDITSMDMVNIINTYYIGKTITMGRKATVLRTALRRLGYTGNFVGRIHKDGGTYLAIRRREQSKAKRYGLKKAYLRYVWELRVISNTPHSASFLGRDKLRGKLYYPMRNMS